MPIPRASRAGDLVLSYGQQGLWLFDQLHPDSPAFNIPRAFRLSGPLSIEALERSLDEIVRRHEALRTTIAVREGEAVQVVAGLCGGGAVADLSGLPGARRG